MQIKAYSLLETILILFILLTINSIFLIPKHIYSRKDEIISQLINAQFKAIKQHERVDINHPLIQEEIWFNMSGNVNEANTVEIIGSNDKFTIMLFTGRIHE
jgi:isocitrate dehydrogenase kinase/phosphatase